MIPKPLGEISTGLQSSEESAPTTVSLPGRSPVSLLLSVPLFSKNIGMFMPPSLLCSLSGVLIHLR